MNSRRKKERSSRIIDIALIVLVIGLAIFLLRGHCLTSKGAPENWQWITCDVGQGDAHLVRTGEQAAYLLDTGDNYPALKDCLSWAGVDRLEAVIITHAHQDHDGALLQLKQDFAELPVATSPHYSRQGDGTQGFKRQGTSTHWFAAGAVFPLQVASVAGSGSTGQPLGQVLWPPEGEESIPGVSGSSSWTNNTSLVIRWVLPARESGQRPLTVLSTGDLEADAARRLLAEFSGQLSTDVLKIAHHGSADSGTGLIISASPSLALISVGDGNSYGHPHQEILDFLEGRAIPSARTDQLGHLALVRNDRGLLLTSSN